MTLFRRELLVAVAFTAHLTVLNAPMASAADIVLSPSGLTQVEVGASEDSWGQKLNDNAAVLNGLFVAGPALKVANGGTGATSASGARTALGLGTAAMADTGTSGTKIPLLDAANTWSAQQTITGNALNLTAGQIAFPASQNPSSNANTLDDYEEGTYTPTASFATPGTSSFSYSSQSGVYTRVGDKVHVEVNIAFTPNIGTASGDLRISLPFAPLAGTFPSGVIGFTSSNVTFSGVPVISGGGGSSFVVVRLLQSGVSSPTMTTSNIGNGVSNTFVFSMNYKVS